jgi:hypothetical protein
VVYADSYDFAFPGVDFGNNVVCVYFAATGNDFLGYCFPHMSWAELWVKKRFNKARFDVLLTNVRLLLWFGGVQYYF